MGLTGDFGQRALDAKGFLTVTGVSSGLDGYELVSRDVAVHQNTFVTHGAAKNDVAGDSSPTGGGRVPGRRRRLGGRL